MSVQCFISSSAGENINICWSPDGSTIAVGNKDDLVTFIDVRSNRSRAEEQFKFEVNEISWNNEGDLFFLTSGNGSIHIFRYTTVTGCSVMTFTDPILFFAFGRLILMIERL